MTDTNKTAHTPGPWEVKDGPWPGFLDISGPSFSIHVVTTASDLSHEDFSKRTADARLIAAAPEMLDALGAVDDAADSMEFDPDSRFGEALTKVRAAWAKATGAPA